ncbi:MAG: hypothetical protein R3F46_01270 [bacterium]
MSNLVDEARVHRAKQIHFNGRDVFIRDLPPEQKFTYLADNYVIGRQVDMDV